MRIFTDLSNKTPGVASELPATCKFLREALDVTEVPEDVLRILFNLSFTHLKYLNKKVAPSSLTGVEKKNQEKAMDDVWVYVMGRVAGDRRAKKSYNIMKDRLVAVLTSGQEYEPVDG